MMDFYSGLYLHQIGEMVFSSRTIFDEKYRCYPKYNTI